jgi:hypothetical protein
LAALFDVQKLRDVTLERRGFIGFRHHEYQPRGMSRNDAECERLSTTPQGHGRCWWSVINLEIANRVVGVFFAEEESDFSRQLNHDFVHFYKSRMTYGNSIAMTV